MKRNKNVSGRRSIISLLLDETKPGMHLPDSHNSGIRSVATHSTGLRFTLIGLCLAFVLPSTLLAQTAHSNGAIRILGNGFNTPSGVVLDGSGNVYVADSANNAVKEIMATNGVLGNYPTVRTLATGFSNPTAIALDASGDVYVADTGNNAVKEIVAVGGSIPENPTVDTVISGLNGPEGVVVAPSGALFVADTGDNEVGRVLSFESYGHIFHTLAAVGSGFKNPRGLAVDASGNLFVADSGHYTVKELSAASNYATVTNVDIENPGPASLAVDSSGNLFVADYPGNEINEILAVNGSIPGTHQAKYTLGAQFLQPQGVAVDAKGNVYVADTGHNDVWEIVAGADFGQVDVGSASSFVLPIFFTFDTAGSPGNWEVFTQGSANLDFTDAFAGSCDTNTVYNAGDSCTVSVTFKPTAPGPRRGAVALLDANGSLLATGYVQGTGVGPRVNFMPGKESALATGFGLPAGVAVGGSGYVIVADWGKNEVVELTDVEGHPSSLPLGSGFFQPAGVAIDGSGNVFVADYGNNAVKEILRAGGAVIALGGSFSGPYAVAVDGSGNVFVADSGNHAVKEILVASGYATTITLSSAFTQPLGVAVDGSGNLFVADSPANSVYEILAVNGSIPANPTIDTLGSGFSSPGSVAVDVNGNVIVADTGNNVVKEMIAVNGSIPASPTINTLGGGYNGPIDLALDAHGNGYVVDSNNKRIVELDYADPPSLQFAATGVGAISSDSPQTVTLSNGGNNWLSSVAPGLTVPPDFKLVAGSGTVPGCADTFTLAEGESCDLHIEFAPLAIGNPLNEALVITDNSLNAGAPGYPNQSIPLSGIGLAPGTSAALTSPAPGTTLTNSSVTFTWSGGVNVSEYELWIGTTGVGSNNLHYPGLTASTSETVSGLPTNAEKLYVRLYSKIDGVWQYHDYTYTSAGMPATLTSPVPGSTLTSSSVTFTWSGGAGVSEYELWVGTTGVGSGNLNYPGLTTATTETVSGLPTNGATLYVRLYSKVAGVWQYHDYTYKAE